MEGSQTPGDILALSLGKRKTWLAYRMLYHLKVRFSWILPVCVVKALAMPELASRGRIPGKFGLCTNADNASSLGGKFNAQSGLAVRRKTKQTHGLFIFHQHLFFSVGKPALRFRF